MRRPLSNHGYHASLALAIAVAATASVMLVGTIYGDNPVIGGEPTPTHAPLALAGELASGTADAPASERTAAGAVSADPVAVDPALSSETLAASAPTTTVPESQSMHGWATYEISIGATGFQAEIDQCLWVRMDFDGVAPVVGAHNYCGGSIVLDMKIGDVVTLAGQGLDGRYLVSGSRDAWPGDNAAEATAGMVSAVILQTCYWHSDQMRLLSMHRINEALPPVDNPVEHLFAQGGL